MKTEGKMITNWIDEHGDPEVDAFIEKNLAITEKVRLAMEQKAWKSQDFAKAMDKSPAEVSKWLSGMHNLTLKSIIKMELALGISLFDCTPLQQVGKVYTGVKIHLRTQGDELKSSTELFELREYDLA